MIHGVSVFSAIDNEKCDLNFLYFGYIYKNLYIRFIPKHRHIFVEERKKNGKACSAVKYWESEMHTVI